MADVKKGAIIGLGLGTALLVGATIVTLGTGLVVGTGLGYLLGKKKEDKKHIFEKPDKKK